jgi:hypothetical protein
MRLFAPNEAKANCKAVGRASVRLVPAKKVEKQQDLRYVRINTDYSN